jgi:hypothetical protein
VYESLNERKFVNDVVLEFIVDLAIKRVNESGSSKTDKTVVITGFFQRMPCLDVVFPQEGDGESELARLKKRSEKESFFTHTRVPCNVFFSVSSGVGVKEKIYEYGFDTVPVFCFPLSNREVWNLLKDVVPLEENAELKSLEADDRDVVLVLSRRDGESVMEGFKKKMNEFVDEVASVFYDEIAKYPYFAMAVNTRFGGDVSTDVYFLSEKTFKSRVMPVYRSHGDLKDVFPFVKSDSVAFFKKVIERVKKEYGDNYAYPVWINIAYHSCVVEVFENVVETVFKNNVNLLFTNALVYDVLDETINGRTFLLIYDDKGLSGLFDFCAEEFKKVEDLVLFRYKVYKETIEKIVNLFD